MSQRLCLVQLSALMLAAAALASAADRAAAPDSTASSTVPDLTYRLERIADGVYCAVAEGVAYVVSNSAVIVGDDGVLVVDTGTGPNEARVLRDAIRAITDRPVRYVVDSHFHFDHTFGHQAFPEALVVAHDATRRLLGPDALSGRTVAGNVAALPARIEKARAEAEREADADKRAALARRAAALAAYHKELATLVPSAPHVIFSQRMTLWLGSREIQLLHLGRGHSAGDVVVFLPQERIVCTGDLFNGYVGYMGDAYVDEWAETLARLAALDFEIVIPGHGAPFKGKDAIAPLRAVLRDLWMQAADLKRAGLSVDAAAARIDLTAHSERFPRLEKFGFEPLAVRRIYEVIDERAAAAPTR